MLKVRIADTPYALEKGLMGVTEMEQDEGMAFVFPAARKLSFWGKNTFIPLDIAFVNKDNKIINIGSIKPHNESPVYSDSHCAIAIEANAGYFKANDVSVGDEMVVDMDSDTSASITFRKVKESSAQKENIKQSQMANNVNVSKPGVDNQVGEPIGNQLQEQPAPSEEQNLPAVSPSDLGQYLEDSYDVEDDDEDQDQNMPQDGLDGTVDQDQEEPHDEDQVDFPVFSNPTEATEWAKDNNQVVRISYTTKKGRQLVRDVEPHGTFHSKSSMREILVTYDETISGIRAFILANIGNWAFVGREFQKKFVVRA